MTVEQSLRKIITLSEQISRAQKERKRLILELGKVYLAQMPLKELEAWVKSKAECSAKLKEDKYNEKSG